MQPSIAVIPQLDLTSASDVEEEEPSDVVDVKAKPKNDKKTSLKEKRKR